MLSKLFRTPRLAVNEAGWVDANESREGDTVTSHDTQDLQPPPPARMESTESCDSPSSSSYSPLSTPSYSPPSSSSHCPSSVPSSLDADLSNNTFFLSTGGKRLLLAFLLSTGIVLAASALHMVALSTWFSSVFLLCVTCVFVCKTKK